MADYKTTINGIKIFEHDYDRWRDRETKSLEGIGAAFKFAEWLRYNDLIDEYETDRDVYNNLSGLRDGNRLDIHDNYRFFDPDNKLEIAFLYIVNGNVWGVLLDKENDSWFGDFEIPNI